MKQVYNIFLFILLLSSVSVTSQVLSGHVYDEKHLPLEGAVVYFDGTTISVSTTAEGYFSIKGDKNIPAALVISFVGFTPVKIDNPYTGKRLEIILVPDAIVMDAAVVTGKTLFSRAEMLKAFREQFLGSNAGGMCKIENEADLRLRFDTSNNTLYAEAVKPLRISNGRLKYIVTFDLIASEIRYRAKSLNPDRIAGAFFGGTTFFTDVSVSGNADRQRKEAYMGSPMHFIKTAIYGNWEEQKFQLFRRSRKINPDNYFVVKDTLGIKKIQILQKSTGKELFLSSQDGKREIPTGAAQQRFEILYNKKVQSFLLYNTGFFYANSNGLFWPLHELTFGGYMGGLRVGDMLPANYKLSD